MKNEKLIKIKINGVEKEISENISIEELLNSLNILDKTMAVAVNMKIVKKDEWQNYKLQDGDKVEALNFVGGG
jgi:sulfur carrier protein